jgi:hypothetical protein
MEALKLEQRPVNSNSLSYLLPLQQNQKSEPMVFFQHDFCLPLFVNLQLHSKSLPVAHRHLVLSHMQTFEMLHEPMCSIHIQSLPSTFYTPIHGSQLTCQLLYHLLEDKMAVYFLMYLASLFIYLPHIYWGPILCCFWYWGGRNEWTQFSLSPQKTPRSV